MRIAIGLHHWNTINDFPNIHNAVISAVIFGKDASLDNVAPTGHPFALAIEAYEMQMTAIAIEKIKIM